MHQLSLNPVYAPRRQCDCFVASRKLEVRQTSLPCSTSTIMAVKACTAGASTIKEVATSHTLPQAALYVQPSSWHSSKPRDTAETCWFCRPVVLLSDGHSYHTERLRVQDVSQGEKAVRRMLRRVAKMRGASWQGWLMRLTSQSALKLCMN